MKRDNVLERPKTMDLKCAQSVLIALPEQKLLSLTGFSRIQELLQGP